MGEWQRNFRRTAVEFCIGQLHCPAVHVIVSDVKPMCLGVGTVDPCRARGFAESVHSAFPSVVG